jgi:hypothetical protein
MENQLCEHCGANRNQCQPHDVGCPNHHLQKMKKVKRIALIKPIVAKTLKNPNDYYVVDYARYSIVRILTGVMGDCLNVYTDLRDELTGHDVEESGTTIIVRDRR